MTDRPTAGPDGFVTGNAAEDSRPFHSWLMGHFVPDDLGMRHSHEVEVKWGVYAQGFGESDWTACRTATTLMLLTSGSHEIAFPHQVVALTKPGDYLIWGPGVPHRWRALEDCTVITIRWPSIPGDTIDVSEEQVTEYRTQHQDEPA